MFRVWEEGSGVTGAGLRSLRITPLASSRGWRPDPRAARLLKQGGPILSSASRLAAISAAVCARQVAAWTEAEIVEDDIERTALDAGPDLLLATLLLEHIDWRRGIEAFAGLRPKACGIIIQENPPDLTTAVTPGRRLPPSVAKAVETAHPALLSRGLLTGAMAAKGYALRDTAIREVADGKRLVGLLFAADP